MLSFTDGICSGFSNHPSFLVLAGMKWTFYPSSWIILLPAWLCWTDMSETDICKNPRTQFWNESPFFMTEAADKVPNQKWCFQSRGCTVYFWNYLLSPFFEIIWEAIYSKFRLELKFICIKSMKASVSLMEKPCNFLTSLFSSTIKMKIMRFMLLTKPQWTKRNSFWIPIKKRSLWKAEPLSTVITKDRSSPGLFQSRRESRA